VCSITPTDSAEGISYRLRAVMCSIRHSLITNNT
jgi:hypothetical protein